MTIDVHDSDNVCEQTLSTLDLDSSPVEASGQPCIIERDCVSAPYPEATFIGGSETFNRSTPLGYKSAEIENSSGSFYCDRICNGLYPVKALISPSTSYIQIYDVNNGEDTIVDLCSREAKCVEARLPNHRQWY